MQNISTTRDRWVWVIAGALMAGTLGLQLVAPLGYGVWLTYFVAVGVTVFQNRPQGPIVVGALLRLNFQVQHPADSSSECSAQRRRQLRKRLLPQHLRE